MAFQHLIDHEKQKFKLIGKRVQGIISLHPENYTLKQNFTPNKSFINNHRSARNQFLLLYFYW